MSVFAQIALAALLIEAAVGYPDALFRRAGHPVTWLGALIARCDAAWNTAVRSPSRRRLMGITLVVLLLGVSLIGGALVMLAASTAGWIGMLVLALLASSLLAQRSLDAHVRAVASGLETAGLEGGRKAVAMIVGRDPDSLDEAGVSRAAIESLAENFSDGIVAPLFWLTAGGLPAAIAYKAVNTADSMVGHKSERHAAFGWAAARLDDLLNLPASRLSVVWLAAAALLLPGASASGALQSVWRDASRHRSPNAGWPEAAMAGALGLRLAGPRSYHGSIVDDHWMGDGRTEATAGDIRRALALYRMACLIQAGALALLVIATL